MSKSLGPQIHKPKDVPSCFDTIRSHMDNMPLRSMNILTPDFKERVDSLDDGDTQQFIVTPAHDGVTLEEAQEEALRWVQNSIEGKCEVSDHYEGSTPTRTLDQFLGE